MTEHFKHDQRSAALGHAGALPMLAAPVPAAKARPRVVAGDGPFLCHVAQASLDLLLLYQHPQSFTGVDAFQLLLRAMCASDRKVERAGLVDGHISLEVDGVALAYGADRLPDRRKGVFFRPTGVNGPSGAGRLGFFLYRHQTCLRLRVACHAGPDLLKEILGLVLQRHPPKAVVIYDSRIVLSVAELLAADPQDLAAMVPDKIVPRPVARYPRPANPRADERVSAFQTRHAGQRPKPLDKFIADSIASREHLQVCAALRSQSGAGRVFGGRTSGARLRLVAASVMALSAIVWIWGQGGGLSWL